MGVAAQGHLAAHFQPGLEELDQPPGALRIAPELGLDLEGDSLMFLELLEMFKKKYSLDIGLESIGKYVMKNPANTVGKIVDLILLIIEHGEKISEIE